MHVKPIVYGRRVRIVMIRASLFLTVLAFAILGSSCASLVRSKDYSIPKLIEPLTNAQFDGLVNQLRQFTELQSLRTSPVYIRFFDHVMSQRYFEANSILVLQRPDKIRLKIQTPGINSTIADMVSEANKFRVAIFYGDYKRFLLGTNDADYSVWRAYIGEKGREALAAARPFHFTDALLMQPLHLGDSRFTYLIEEALIEEDDTKKNAKKDSRLQRSFYVIAEIELPSSNQGQAKIRRKFWFDRTNSARFARQQIFDDQGGITTEVFYANYVKLSSENNDQWPSIVRVSRPHDGYSALLTFNNERFDINPGDLKPEAFRLENTEKLPETDLDKPPTP